MSGGNIKPKRKDSHQKMCSAACTSTAIHHLEIFKTQLNTGPGQSTPANPAGVAVVDWMISSDAFQHKYFYDSVINPSNTTISIFIPLPGLNQSSRSRTDKLLLTAQGPSACLRTTHICSCYLAELHHLL